MAILLSLLALCGPLWAQGAAVADDDKAMQLEASQIHVKVFTLSALLEPVVTALRTEACQSGETEIIVTDSGNVFCQADVMIWEPQIKRERQKELLIGAMRDLGDAAGPEVRVFRDQDGKGYLVHQSYVKGAKTLAQLKRNNAVYDGLEVFLAVGMAKGALWLKSESAKVQQLSEHLNSAGFDGALSGSK